jgi:hypothetical protein
MFKHLMMYSKYRAVLFRDNTNQLLRPPDQRHRERQYDYKRDDPLLETFKDKKVDVP